MVTTVTMVPPDADDPPPPPPPPQSESEDTATATHDAVVTALVESDHRSEVEDRLDTIETQEKIWHHEIMTAMTAIRESLASIRSALSPSSPPITPPPGDVDDDDASDSSEATLIPEPEPSRRHRRPVPGSPLHRLLRSGGGGG